MRALAGEALRAPAAPAVLLGALAVVAVAAVSGHGAKYVAPVVVVTSIVVTLHRRLLQWHGLVGLILAVVLFVPIGRYNREPPVPA
jgi:hypothetical protein